MSSLLVHIPSSLAHTSRSFETHGEKASPKELTRIRTTTPSVDEQAMNDAVHVAFTALSDASKLAVHKLTDQVQMQGI